MELSEAPGSQRLRAPFPEPAVVLLELPVGARCDDEGRNNAEEIQDTRDALLDHEVSSSWTVTL